MWGWFVESISIPLANHPKDLADNFFFGSTTKAVDVSYFHPCFQRFVSLLVGKLRGSKGPVVGTD